MNTRILFGFLSIIFFSCEQPISFPQTIQFGLLTLDDRYPTSVQQGKDHQILFSYPTDGDSVLIHAHHFREVIDAYAQWLQYNSTNKDGVFLSGRYRRFVWRGNWLFQLDLPLYQRPEDSTLNQFFAKFPGSQEVLTGDLSSFPIRYRQNGGASISRLPFWGVDLGVPILTQRYRDDVSTWTLAKPLGIPSAQKWKELTSLLQEVKTAPCETYRISTGYFSVYKKKDATLIAWGNRTPQALCMIVEHASLGL